MELFLEEDTENNYVDTIDTIASNYSSSSSSLSSSPILTSDLRSRIGQFNSVFNLSDTSSQLCSNLSSMLVNLVANWEDLGQRAKECLRQANNLLASSNEEISLEKDSFGSTPLQLLGSLLDSSEKKLLHPRASASSFSSSVGSGGGLGGTGHQPESQKGSLADSAETVRTLFVSLGSKVMTTTAEIFTSPTTMDNRLGEEDELLEDLSSSLSQSFSTVSSLLNQSVASSSTTTTTITTTLIEEPPEYNWIFLFMTVFIFIGIVGNLLVCLAICLERRLQNATNYFLLSLAVADLLVCVVVMPILIMDDFYGYWPFGPTLCNFWVTCDVLCSTSSIIHMCFISVGRYIGIRNPLHARQAPLLVSRRAVMLKIALVWILSAIITSPLTIIAIIDRSNIQPEPQSCRISNPYFEILGSIGAFFLPMLVMVNTYILTVRLLKRKAKFCQDAAQGTCNSSDNRSSSGQDNNSSGQKAKRSVATRHSIRDAFRRRPSNSSTSSAVSGTSGSVHLMVNRPSTGPNESPNSRRVQNNTEPSASNLSLHQWPSTEKQASSKSSSGGRKKQRTTSNNKKSRNTQPLMVRTLGSSLQVRTEQKATKVLGLVFFVFVLCWTPFFTLNVISGLSPTTPIPDFLASSFQWLGFISSTINPIIYTIFNRNFRRAFNRILLCKMLRQSPQSSHTMRRKASNYELTHRSTIRCGGNGTGFVRSQSSAVGGAGSGSASFGGDGSRLSRQSTHHMSMQDRETRHSLLRPDSGVVTSTRIIAKDRQLYTTLDTKKMTLSCKFKSASEINASEDYNCDYSS